MAKLYILHCMLIMSVTDTLFDEKEKREKRENDDNINITSTMDVREKERKQNR